MKATSSHCPPVTGLEGRVSCQQTEAMKNKLFVVVLGAVLSVTASAQKIVIKGSDTLGAKMVPQLAEAYKAGGEKASFEIAAEGSSQAFSALLAKAGDIAGHSGIYPDRIFLSGRADRVRRDSKDFGNPSEKQTEDYVTGRFG